MERDSMFLGRKNQYCENNYTTKCNLQIQCCPCQITNCIFHRTRTKNFKIHMETQKTSYSQSNLEKGEWSWKNQSSWFQTILQCYTHQENMVQAEIKKYRTMDQDKSPEINPHTYAQLISDKGGKTIQWRNSLFNKRC